MLDRGVFETRTRRACADRTTDLVEQTRRAVLEYFNAPADEYPAVFTANAPAR